MIRFAGTYTILGLRESAYDDLEAKLRQGEDDADPVNGPGEGCQDYDDGRDACMDPVSESTQRYCKIQKAKDGKWYLWLADREYGEYEDARIYGPFHSEDDLNRELNRHSNPGGMNYDDSGKAPAPKESPDGSPVIRPR